MKRNFRKTPESLPADEPGEAGAETLEEAAAEAGEAPAPPAPLVKRAAYKALYAVSFGTVFTSLLLRKLLVPKNSVIESALHDGAVAARHSFEEKERLVEETVKETEDMLSVEELPAVPA